MSRTYKRSPINQWVLTYARMFTAVLFIVADKGKQLKCPQLTMAKFDIFVSWKTDQY